MELVRDYEMYSKRIEDQKSRKFLKDMPRMREACGGTQELLLEYKTKTKVLYHENESNRLKIKEK